MTLFACLQKILPGEQSRNGNVAAEVTVLEWLDDQSRSESRVQLVDHFLQLGSEERSGEDRARRLAQLGRAFTFELSHEFAELVCERSDHADSVFDLRIVAVM